MLGLNLQGVAVLSTQRRNKRLDNLEQVEKEASAVIQQPEHKSLTLDECFDEIIRRQDFKERHSMPMYKEVQHTFKKKQPIAVSFLSDVHLGASGTDYKQLREDIQTIRDTDGLYVIHNGDEINNFIIGRLTAVSRNDSFQPTEQWWFCKLFFAELASKTLAAARGNHTDWTEMLAAIDYRAEILGDLNILDIGFGGNVVIDVAGAVYTIRLRHKYRYESTLNPFNAILRMHEFEGPFDVGVIGHTHVAAIGEIERQGKNLIAVRPGAYKVKDAYADEWGFPPAQAISPTVVLHPETKEIEWFKTCKKAADYLTYLRSR